MVKVSEILNKLEEVAPVALSDEFCKKYSLYDNSGIIIDACEKVSGVLFSLDLSKKAVQEAINNGFNLIVTHHPAIYGGVSRISADDAIAKCIKHGISVISMHLNFDAATEGIDYHLMKALGGAEAEIHCSLPNGGYGRVYDIAPCTFESYSKKITQTFSNRALFYGDSAREIKRVASFCGAGYDDKSVAFALSHGADVFVSSDLKHHEITALLEKGLNVIHLTHYSAENYGFNKIYLKIREELFVPSVYFTDDELL